MSLRLRDLSYGDMACLEGGVVLWFQAIIIPWFPIGPSAAWHLPYLPHACRYSIPIAIIPFIVGINYTHSEPIFHSLTISSLKREKI